MARMEKAGESGARVDVCECQHELLRYLFCLGYTCNPRIQDKEKQKHKREGKRRKGGGGGEEKQRATKTGSAGSAEQDPDLELWV